MKILAIRGKNLASLTSEFCVDFQAEPLASAGLYAITGPTGAGKSTLLDALCLALYESTPRLGRASTKGEIIPDVGDNTVGPLDSRTILQRGAAEGYAEVDFIGSDAVPYRARWSVRRARNKGDGKLQNSDVTLVRLTDNQSLGDHRKTETLKLIERCVGLNFDQFTRAVLLAQNEFAAFMKASDDDRAELLQTLTGTETFTNISKQAFVRSRVENDELNRLKLQHADQEPMTPDVRATKETELAAQEVKVKATEQQQATIESYLRWHEQWERIKVSAEDATAKLEQAKVAKDEAITRYELLARVEAAQDARPLCAEVDRLDREISGGGVVLKQAVEQLAQTAKIAEESKQQLDVATRHMEVSEQSKATAQPQIDQAKTLDAQITALTPNYQAAIKARDEAKQNLGKEEENLCRLQNELVQSQKSLENNESWLAEHTYLSPLAEGWQRWETLLTQASGTLGERSNTHNQEANLAKNDERLKAQLDKAKADHAAYSAEHKAATGKLESLVSACAVFNSDEMDKSKQSLESRRNFIVSAEHLWNIVCEQQQRQQQLESDKQTLTATLNLCELQLRQCAEDKPLAERDQINAEKSLRIAELATNKNVEQMRSLLEADNPCPVCGAVNHPYAEHNPQLDSILIGLREEVTKARNILTDLLERAAVEQMRKLGTQSQLDKNNIDLAAANTSLLSTQQRWAVHLLNEELSAVADADRGAWLSGQQAIVKAELELVSQEDARYRDAIRQRDTAQKKVADAQLALDTAKAKVVQLELDYQKTALERQSTLEKLSAIERQLNGTLTDLDAAFPDSCWRENWLADTEFFFAQCKSDTAVWLQQRKALQGNTQLINTLAASITAAEEACVNATRYQSIQVDHYGRLERDMQVKQTERNALLEGKPIIEVEALLNVMIENAKATLLQRQTDNQKADSDCARLDEAVRQARGQLEKNQTALESAKQAQLDWLQVFNTRHEEAPLFLDELKEILIFDAGWIAAERQALQALNSAIETAQAVLLVRQGALSIHEKEKSTEETAEALRELLLNTSTELEPAKEQAATLRVELTRDDERRQKSQTLMDDIEKQNAKTRVWSQLSELIGSADGKKFRNFAQQMTLDVLLGYANHQLESLSRRYKLERIKNSLGLLVVDQDMGDEVRSVHSLSGGESFLVSLALALGLASLSSHRVRVESLFIDEGFGSLDADSLRVAMEALDNLQSQGRKVGVISHVQEMTERIGTRIEVRRLSGGQSRVLVTN